MDDQRALRRMHVQRLKKNRQGYWGRQSEQEQMSPKLLGKVAQTPATCSCWMCGNDRKHFKHRTVQERRQMQDC